jgi:hypothetical protein
MSRTRTTERLSEIDERVVAAAEADLDRLLSIEPSAEFAASVRARISERGVARGWRLGWLGLGLASAATLVVAFTTGGNQAGDDLAKTRDSHPQPDIVLRAPAPSLAPSLKTPSLAIKHVAGTFKTATPAIKEPAVLIDASFAQAIRRLALSTANLALEETTRDASAAPISDAPVPSVVVEPLRVPELVLKPADQTAVGQTDREHKE